MPFDFAAYKAKCDALSTEELQLEWQNYTRQLTSGATMTASSFLMSPITNGISLVALGITVPQIHNARKKRAIIGNTMQLHGTEPQTRRRDITIPAATSIAAAALTLGFTPPIAEFIGGESGAKGIEYLVSHATLDALWAMFDEAQNACHRKISRSRLKRQCYREKQQQHQTSKVANTSAEYLALNRDRDAVRSRYYKLDSCRNQGFDEKDNFFNNYENLPPYPNNSMYHGGFYDPYLTNRRPSQVASTRRLHFEDSPRLSISSSAGSRRLSASHPRARSSSRIRGDRGNQSDSEGFSDQESDDDLYCNRSNNEDSDSDSDSDNDSDSDDDRVKDGKIIEHVLTLEEEVSMLKATILQMEMEKRGMVAESNPKVNPSLISKKNNSENQNITVKAVSFSRRRKKLESQIPKLMTPPKYIKRSEANQPNQSLSSPLPRLSAQQFDKQSPSLCVKTIQTDISPKSTSRPTTPTSPNASNNSLPFASSSEQLYNDVLSSNLYYQQRPLRKRQDSGHCSRASIPEYVDQYNDCKSGLGALQSDSQNYQSFTQADIQKKNGTNSNDICHSNKIDIQNSPVSSMAIPSFTLQSPTQTTASTDTKCRLPNTTTTTATTYLKDQIFNEDRKQVHPPPSIIISDDQKNYPRISISTQSEPNTRAKSEPIIRTNSDPITSAISTEGDWKSKSFSLPPRRASFSFIGLDNDINDNYITTKETLRSWRAPT